MAKCRRDDVVCVPFKPLYPNPASWPRFDSHATDVSARIFALRTRGTQAMSPRLFSMRFTHWTTAVHLCRDCVNG